MGNSNSVKKINFQDMQKVIYKKDFIIINTLESSKQNCLILNTISPEKEIEIINNYLKKEKNINIVIYGENCNDNRLLNKYNQLNSLGFTYIFVYIGGLFEWLLLQDIYGDDMFPTTQKELDILKYMPSRILEKLL